MYHYNFILPLLSELKLSKQEYANTSITKIWQEERQNCEIINITLQN